MYRELLLLFILQRKIIIDKLNNNAKLYLDTLKKIIKKIISGRAKFTISKWILNNELN